MTLIGGVVAALIGAVAAISIEAWRRKRKILGFEILSAGLIIPFESQAGDDLEVRVRSTLVQDAVEAEEFVPAGKVYGFRVRLKNVGNVPIESQDVFVMLDGGAKMLSLEVEEGPVELWGRIVTDRQHGNRFTGQCLLPFLNPGQDIILSVQSVDNEVPACLVYAPGAGLVLRDLEAWSLAVRAALLVPAVVGWGLVAAGVLADLPNAARILMTSVGAVMMLPPLSIGLVLSFGRRRRERAHDLP
jgi:hypothetical protein